MIPSGKRYEEVKPNVFEIEGPEGRFHVEGEEWVYNDPPYESFWRWVVRYFEPAFAPDCWSALTGFRHSTKEAAMREVEEELRELREWARQPVGQRDPWRRSVAL